MENKFEITYTQKGDYLYPDLTLTPQPDEDIGKYGRMRRKFLIEHRNGTYSLMILREELYTHLREINRQANERISALVKELAEAEGVTEDMKANDQLGWVQRMNNIKARAEEIVTDDLIYV